MISCWFWIDSLLGAWNQMMEQFSNFHSNLACSFNFRFPEIWLQNEGVLPVVSLDLEPFWGIFRFSFVLAGSNLSQFAHLILFVERSVWWNCVVAFIASLVNGYIFWCFQTGISGVVPDNERFLGAALLYLDVFGWTSVLLSVWLIVSFFITCE